MNQRDTPVADRLGWKFAAYFAAWAVVCVAVYMCC